MCCVMEHGDGRYVVLQRRVCVRVTVHVTKELNQIVVDSVIVEEENLSENKC